MPVLAQKRTKQQVPDHSHSREIGNMTATATLAKLNEEVSAIQREYANGKMEMARAVAEGKNVDPGDIAALLADNSISMAEFTAVVNLLIQRIEARKRLDSVPELEIKLQGLVATSVAERQKRVDLEVRHKLELQEQVKAARDAATAADEARLTLTRARDAADELERTANEVYPDEVRDLEMVRNRRRGIHNRRGQIEDRSGQLRSMMAYDQRGIDAGTAHVETEARVANSRVELSDLQDESDRLTAELATLDRKEAELRDVIQQP